MRFVHVHHDVFSVLFLLLPHTFQTALFRPIFTTLNPNVKVATLIIHNTIYYIAQRKKKKH